MRTASVLLPTCRQEECAKVVSGSPSSVTGPEGPVQEPQTPGLGVAVQMGSSLHSPSQGSTSGTYPVCHTDGLGRQQTSLSRSGNCQRAAVKRQSIGKLRLLLFGLIRAAQGWPASCCKGLSWGTGCVLGC